LAETLLSVAITDGPSEEVIVKVDEVESVTSGVIYDG